MMKKSKYIIPVLLFLAACGAKETPVRDLEAERLYKISILDTTTLKTIIDPDTVEGFDLLDNLTAQAWILIDDKTGYVISEKKSRERMYIASLTKMMTCLLALEHGSDSDSVYITQSDYVSRDSRVKLDQGYLLRDLINEMMLVSDNDAAYAIARHIGGDTTAFCNKMNEKAAYLGMTATHYDNPNGLPNDSNYSSAYDQLRLVRYCMEDSVFAQVVGSREARVPLLDGRHMDCINTNRLLFTYDGCLGVKTGFTYQAGACLAASVERDGVRLYVILLKSQNMRLRFKEAAVLLDYGFRVMSYLR
ncbi:MAG: D-alanyl-D-alanine carboxypeptidase [Prevotella sp.]|nr:D-alanyl-D-alanine carboxypeptidase [Prevotella sp.]